MTYVGFNKLVHKLAGKPGVKDPKAVAAAIGRRKYGASTYNRAAAKGRKLG